MVRPIRLDAVPEEVVMQGRSFFSSMALISITSICTLQLSAQAPNSFLAAVGSYAQQSPAKGLEEAQHFSIGPELRGDILMAHQRYIAALDTYRQVPGNSAVVWNKMGIANHHMFNLREAERDYKEALKLNPSYPEAWNNLGAVYYGQKNYHNAEKAYKKAIKLNPKSAMFYSNLGTAYLAEHKYKKGEGAYRTALSLDPNVFEADPASKISEMGPTQELATLNFLLAKTYAEAGRKNEALIYLRKAIDEGFADRKKIQEEKEFAILRDVPEFQRMMSDKHE